MTIGEKISTRRKELGLTLEDIGNFVGVGKSTVKKWESGYIANMRRDKIAALSKVLQMNPAEFINSNSEDNFHYDSSNETTYPPLNILEIFEQNFGKATLEMLKLFLRLDTLDQGRVIGNIEEILKSDKYTKIVNTKHVMQAARDGETVGVVETTTEEETKLTNTPLLNFDL